MKTKFIDQTAFSTAYARWFSSYEQERKRRRVRRGSALEDFPPAPISPEAIQSAVDRIGRVRVLQVFGIHRMTLHRWITGEILIPRPAWLLMVAMAEGRLPGMSADWSEFRFVGDEIHLVGTRYSWSAREISGWPYQLQHAEALKRRISELEKQLAQLVRLGQFDCANDPLILVG